MQDINDIIDIAPIPFTIFDYVVFSAILLLFFTLVVYLFFRFKPTKVKKIDLDFSDKEFAYRASDLLQDINSSEAQELLEELKRYKYKQLPPPLPNSLKERIIRVVNAK